MVSNFSIPQSLYLQKQTIFRVPEGGANAIFEIKIEKTVLGNCFSISCMDKAVEAVEDQRAFRQLCQLSTNISTYSLVLTNYNSFCIRLTNKHQAYLQENNHFQSSFQSYPSCTHNPSKANMRCHETLLALKYLSLFIPQ